MRFLDGTIVGLCYGFSMGLANLWKVLSAEEGLRYLWPPRRDIPRMLGKSLLYALVTAVGILGADRVFKGFDNDPAGGVRVSVVELLFIAWGVVAVTGVAASAAYRLSQSHRRQRRRTKQAEDRRDRRRDRYSSQWGLHLRGARRSRPVSFLALHPQSNPSRPGSRPEQAACQAWRDGAILDHGRSGAEAARDAW